MMDATFIAAVREFFFGNTKPTMEAFRTSADRATYFLDNIIENALDMYFVKLLNAMEAYKSAAGQLAIEIKESIQISMLLQGMQ